MASTTLALEGDLQLEVGSDYDVVMTVVYPKGHPQAGRAVDLSVFDSGFVSEIRTERGGDLSDASTLLATADIGFFTDGTDGKLTYHIEGDGIVNTWPASGEADLFGRKTDGTSKRILTMTWAVNLAATDHTA
jgi:hypothetical protein